MSMPVCRRCKKRADEIHEYLVAAKDEEMDVETYVKNYEGTYNAKLNQFLCTPCYIAEGMPASPSGWKVGDNEH